MNKKIKVAIYIRVSTGGQNTEGQESELKEYAKNRGWEVGRIYRDKITGTTTSRPGLSELMADAKKRRVNVVAVWRFDRFARSVSHLLQALETFRSVGIDFVSISEQVDTSTPTGKMVFTVLGAVAELERSLIAERVRAGMRNARAKGKRIGRPPRTYLDQDTRRSIYEAYAIGGASLRRLAVRFGTSVGTVQRC